MLDNSSVVGPQHLQPTPFIDSDNPAVRAFASRAVDGARDDRERISRLFAAVRDAIRYDPYTATDDSGDYVPATSSRAGRRTASRRPCCLPPAPGHWGSPPAWDSPTCATICSLSGSES